MSLVNATQAAFFTIEEMEFFTHIVDDGDGSGMKVLDEAKCPRYILECYELEPHACSFHS